MSQALSPFSIFEAVGIKTKEASSGFFPNKFKNEFLIELFDIPADVKHNFIEIL